MSQEAETPEPRRARLLELARAAQRKADEATDLDIREQYLEIAVQWTLLAEEAGRFGLAEGRRVRGRRRPG